MFPFKSKRYGSKYGGFLKWAIPTAGWFQGKNPNPRNG